MTLPAHNDASTLEVEVLAIAHRRHMHSFAQHVLRSLAASLSPGRYHHTLEVIVLADRIALHHFSDQPQTGHDAFAAALLHDITKEMSSEEHLEILRKTDSPRDWFNAPPQVLHSKSGAAKAKADYPELPIEVIDAIAYHTTGHPGMDNAARTLFCADYLSGGEWVGMEARISETPDKICLEKVKTVICKLVDREKEIQADTSQFYRSLIGI